jgi:predicted nucleic acid-binding protein
VPERVLLDTSAIYAVVSPSDQFHQRAAHEFSDLIDRGGDLWVSSYVLVETYVLVQRRLGLETLRKVRDAIESVCTVHWIDSEDHERAWRLWLRRGAAGLSFVDWSTLVVSKRLGTSLFTYDQALVSEISQPPP